MNLTLIVKLDQRLEIYSKNYRYKSKYLFKIEKKIHNLWGVASNYLF